MMAECLSFVAIDEIDPDFAVLRTAETRPATITLTHEPVRRMCRKHQVLCQVAVKREQFLRRWIVVTERTSTSNARLEATHTLTRRS